MAPPVAVSAQLVSLDTPEAGAGPQEGDRPHAGVSGGATRPQGRRRPLAPAVFVGWFRGNGLFPDFALWELTADIPGHPKGSSVSTDTLLQAGYRVEWEETL